MMYGKEIGRKFNEDGTARHFMGNTVVADVTPECDAYPVMQKLRQMVIEEGFDYNYILLPEDSYHMTVLGGLNDQSRLDFWPQALAPDASMVEADDHVTEAVKRVGLPGKAKMKFDSVGAGKGCVIIRLVPVNEEQEAILRGFRDRCAEAMGVFRPKHAEYRFHISLAYTRILPEGEEELRWKQLVAKMDAFLKEQPPFETTEPYMAYFNDMLYFSPVRVPRTANAKE